LVGEEVCVAVGVLEKVQVAFGHPQGVLVKVKVAVSTGVGVLPAAVGLLPGQPVITTERRITRRDRTALILNFMKHLRANW
jgi:hypothetical protein